MACLSCRVRKAYRLELLDLDDLATTLGLSRDLLWHWINKKGPPPPNRTRVTQYLDTHEILLDDA